MGKTSGSASTYCNLTLRWDESFADDLIVRGSAVSSRVALLLRSAEANLLSSRFVLSSLSLSLYFRVKALGVEIHFSTAPD